MHVLCDAHLPNLQPAAPPATGPRQHRGDVDISLWVLCTRWHLHSQVSGLPKDTTLKPTQKGRSEAQRCSVMGKGWGGSMMMMTSAEPSASIFSVFPCLCNPLTASDSSSLLLRAPLGRELSHLCRRWWDVFPCFKGHWTVPRLAPGWDGVFVNSDKCCVFRRGVRRMWACLYVHCTATLIISATATLKWVKFCSDLAPLTC